MSRQDYDWMSVMCDHHKDVGKVINGWENEGWELHTYSAASYGHGAVNHYLLFHKRK